MTRLESSAWTLAGGTLCAFVVAVLLSEAPWSYAFMALAAVAAAWSSRAPLVVGFLIGAIAWSLLTGFDVNRYGHLAITGSGDAIRAALLIAAAGCGAVAGRLWTGPADDSPAMGGEPPAPEHDVLAGVHQTSRVSDGRYRRSVKVPM